MKRYRRTINPSRFILLLIGCTLLFYSNAYSDKPPYPIIFIHGLGGGDQGWYEEGIAGRLSTFGWINAGSIDVCLDMKHNSLSESNIEEDVENFTPVPNKGDFYFINFNVDSHGNRCERTFHNDVVFKNIGTSDQTISLTTTDGFQVGDIIRIDNEIMYVTGIGSSSITVERGREGTEPSSHLISPVYIISNQSHNAAIKKQGKGVKLAIDAVKSVTGTKKVILIAHSMGGLAAREYLQSSYYEGDVAKLVTLDTPHLGSTLGDIIPEVLQGLLPELDIDEKSDAVRDLRYSYIKDYLGSYPPEPPYGDPPDDATYLFGGDESEVPVLVGDASYYSADVNCDGKTDGTVTGLNPENLPHDVEYHWVIGDVSDIVDGDGVVRADRQYLSSIGDTELIRAVHIEQLEQYWLWVYPAVMKHHDAIIRGLDEPDNFTNAYKIPLNKLINGFTTEQTDGFGKIIPGGPDSDFYTFTLNEKSRVIVKVGNIYPDVSDLSIGLYRADKSLVAQANSSGRREVELSFDGLEAGEYYVNVEGAPTPNSWQSPYRLEINDVTPPTVANMEIRNQSGNLVGEGGTVSGTVTVSAQVTGHVAIDAVTLLVDGFIIGEMTNTGGNTYKIEWDTTYPGPGNRIVEVMATDVNRNWNSITQKVNVNNSISVSINLNPSSVKAGDPFTISGQVKDAGGSPLSGVTVSAKIGSTPAGSDDTDGSGNYSISATAPGTGGTFTVKVEAKHNDAVGSAEDTLTVSIPSRVDLAINSPNWGVSPISFDAPQAIRVFGLRITNLGTESSSGGFLHYRIKQSSGQEVDYHKEQIPNIGAGKDWDVPELNDSSFEVPSGASEGPYYVEVHVDYPNDSNQGNNRDSRSIYNGEPPETEAYERFIPPPAKPGSPPYTIHTDSFGDYQLFVILVFADDQVRFKIMQGNQVLTDDWDVPSGEYRSWQDKFIVYVAGLTKFSEVLYEVFAQRTSVPLTVSPQHAFSTAGSRLEYQITVPNPLDPQFTVLPLEDGAGAMNWEWHQSRHGEIPDTWKWYTDLPSDQPPLSNRSFWMKVRQPNANSAGYAKKLQVTVVASHDISVSNLSPSNGTPYNPGAQIPVSATVSAANGYTESPNVSLSISGPGEYSYTDSETPTISGLQTVTFSPSWNTAGLQPGDYTITVTATIGNDSNSGNNSQSATVHLNAPPQLVVNAQPDQTSHLQGETIALHATVTGNSNPVTDAEVVAHIIWPDGSQTTPVMTYDSGDGRYEYPFIASQQGVYSGNVTASKSGFSDGSGAFANITVNNSPPETTITSTYPAEGQWIRTQSVTFLWTGSDAGTPVSQLQYARQLDAGAWTAYSADTRVDLSNLSEGSHTFKVKAYDGIAEDPTPATRTFSVDSMPPVVEITTNGGNDFSTKESQVTLEGTASDAAPSSGLASVVISSGDANIGSLSNWSFTVDLSDGANVFMITTTDGAGNLGFDTITITYTPGVITLTAPNGGETIQGGSNYTITWQTTGSDIDHIHLLYSTDSGASYEDIPDAHKTENDGDYDWNTLVIDSSTMRVKAIAEDANNTELGSDESDADFTLTTVPEPPLSSPFRKFL